MAGTWISDMQHFAGIDDPELGVPARARKIGQYLGRIVSAGTAWYPEQPLESVIPCRRRPGNRSCPGHIRLVRQQDGNIIWQCSDCGDNGMIHGWQGTFWDLSGPEQVSEFIAVVPADVYQAVAGIADLPRPALRVVMRAAIERDDVLLTGTRAELDSMKSTVGKAARKARGRRKELFGQLLQALENPSAGEGIGRDGKAPGPREKISETLLVFAEPLLDALGPDAPMAAVKNVLTIAMTVWNAMVLQPRRADNSYLDQARKLIAVGVPQMAPMFEMLVERKKQYFATDLRSIGDFQVYRNPDGELRVTAEARMSNPPRTIH